MDNRSSANKNKINLGTVDLTSPLIFNDPNIPFILSRENVGIFFHAGENEFILGDQPYQFTSTYAFSVTTDDYENLKIDVVDTREQQRIGEGTNTYVYPVVGSIKYRYTATDAGFIFVPGADKSVVKLGIDYTSLGDEYIQQVINEYDRIVLATTLRVRPPTFGRTDNDVISSSLPQRHIKGIELLEYLNPNQAAKLTIDDRYQLSIILYRELAKQIHEAGLVHCDIKPENIKVYKDERGWHVNILDLSTAQTEQQKHKNICGTYAYLDKEAFTGNFTEKTDIFAMTLVISMLWGNQTQINIHNNNDKDTVFNLRNDDNWLIQFDKLKETLHLPDECRQSFNAFLTKATDIDRNKRPTLLDCVTDLENQYMQYKKITHSIPDNKVNAAEAGLNSGIKVYGLYNRYYKKEINHQSIEDLKSAITDEIAKLPDDEYAIHEFEFATGVAHLQNIHAKSGLLEEVNKIIDNFFKSYSESKDLITSINLLEENFKDHIELLPLHEELKNYRDNLIEFHKKILRTRVDLDEIASATTHLQRKSAKVRSDINYFRNKLASKNTGDQRYTPNK